MKFYENIKLLLTLIINWDSLRFFNVVHSSCKKTFQCNKFKSLILSLYKIIKCCLLKIVWDFFSFSKLIGRKMNFFGNPKMLSRQKRKPSGAFPLEFQIPNTFNTKFLSSSHEIISSMQVSCSATRIGEFLSCVDRLKFILVNKKDRA